MKTTQIRFVIGAGGVGKTSLSSAIAYSVAKKQNKVLVLTIDPAQRLKTALKLVAESSQPQLVEKDGDGELWAGLLNPQMVFEEFLRRGIGDGPQLERILKNPLYRALSTELSGSQEFTSLELLAREIETQKWDYIFVDTPPTQNALEFLRASQKISALFQEDIAKWFRTPDSKTSVFFLQKWLAAGSQQALKILGQLTGAEFVFQLQDFFNQIQSWQSQLESRLRKLDQILKEDNCQFHLVSSADFVKIKWTYQIAKSLKGQGYNLKTWHINRSRPWWLVERPGEIQDSELNQWAKRTLQFYDDRDQQIDQIRQEIQKDLQLVLVPELEYEIDNFESIQRLSKVYERFDSL